MLGRIRIRSGKPKYPTKGARDTKDITLVRCAFNNFGLSPTIELRIPLDILLEKYPEARGLAERWQISSPWGLSHGLLGAVAVHVPAEHIEDVARLAVVALRDGVTRTLTMQGNQIRIDRGKMKSDSVSCLADIVNKRNELYRERYRHHHREIQRRRRQSSKLTQSL